MRKLAPLADSFGPRWMEGAPTNYSDMFAMLDYSKDS